MTEKRFRLQEPDRIDERRLIGMLNGRSTRLGEYLDMDFAPAVLKDKERELLDKACGEWCHRRGGGIESVMELLRVALSKQDKRWLLRKYELFCDIGCRLPQDARAHRIMIVRKARQVAGLIEIVEQATSGIGGSVKDTIYGLSALECRIKLARIRTHAQALLTQMRGATMAREAELSKQFDVELAKISDLETRYFGAKEAQ